MSSPAAKHVLGGWYTLCSLGGIGLDRAGIMKHDQYKNDDEVINLPLLAYQSGCFGPIAINQPLAWILYGREAGRTPYYKPSIWQ